MDSIQDLIWKEKPESDEYLNGLSKRKYTRLHL